MNMEIFFNEIYKSQEEQSLTEYVLKHWMEGLRFLDNDHEKLELLQSTARQCIANNQRDIYDLYTRNILIEKGVLKY